MATDSLTVTDHIQSIYDSAIAPAWRRACIEAHIARIILAHHRRGIDWAERCGLSAGHYEQPDARCIHVAADVLRERQLIDVLRGVRWMMRHEHLWRDDVPAHTSDMLWWPERLAAAACAAECIALLPMLAMDLLACIDAERRAAA